MWQERVSEKKKKKDNTADPKINQYSIKVTVFFFIKKKKKEQQRDAIGKQIALLLGTQY